MSPELFKTVLCPYCGQAFEIPIDVSSPDPSFVTDCEICCRPMTIAVSRDANDEVSVSAHAE
jgi:hypothetical protein